MKLTISKLIGVFELVATLAGVDAKKIKIVLGILGLISSGTLSFTAIAEYLEGLLPEMGDEAEKLSVGIKILKILGEES